MRSIHIVQTAYGPYKATSFEVSAFRYVYRDKWLDELVSYATNLTEQEFLLKIEIEQLQERSKQRVFRR